MADSLAWGKLMALQIEGNYRGELLRAAMARTISPADLAVLYPEYPKDAPTTLAAMLPIYRRLGLGRLYRALPSAVGPHYASNNWVVDGKHSASGKPLLANDPHLAFGAPGPWYLARLKTPGQEIAGATAAGVPLVVIGHNDHIAWGFTTTTADVEDLFVEKVDPADPTKYLTPDGSAPFVTRRETILVRGATSVEITVRATRHGPVLSDVLPPGTADPGYVLALSATFLVPDDRSAEALWDAEPRAPTGRASNAHGAILSGRCKTPSTPTISGTIGFIAPGLVPIRKKGDGWMPAPGWTGDYDWNGFIPFDASAECGEPALGPFCQRQQQDRARQLSLFPQPRLGFAEPRRADQRTCSTATPVQTPATSAAIQADTFSLMAERLVPLMTRIAPADQASRDAIGLLRRWDFHMDRDKAAPLLFTAWLRQFSYAVLFGRFGDAVAGYWDLKPRVMETVLTERQDWCDDPKRPGSETCAARLAQSLAAALAELRHAYGGDMTRWQWGRAHVAVFPNPVFARIPVLRDWFDPSIATPGAYDTVNRGPSIIRDEVRPFEQVFGAGLRIITDLAAPADARMIVTPGQSGNPLSSHFADLMRRWRDFGLARPRPRRPRLHPRPGPREMNMICR